MHALVPTPFRAGLRWFLPVLATLVLSVPSKAATSVTQFGVTWYFADDHQVGQFANGDWWVVGPVTLTRITPDTVGDRNGTMINPGIGKDNGWDSRIKYGQYSSALNIAKSLPRTVQPGSSVASAISFAANATGDNPQMETIAVLTVLGSAAPAGSFRPPYQGSDKTLKWNASQLNYGVLRKLAPVANTPSLSVVQNYFERPWIEKETTWVGRYFHPSLNHPFQNRSGVGTYGREMAHTAADGLLSLQLNYTDAQKQTLAIRMVQAGLDIYGAARLGASWLGDGGHNQGRKMVLLLAGMMLGDSDILRFGDGSKLKIFQEDSQTFYVTATDVSRSHVGTNGAPVENYVTADIGMPEWGAKHQTQPEFDNKRWDAPYRIVTGPCTVGHVLTARLMGIESKWNYPAVFDYYDRFYAVEKGNVASSTNSIQPFVSAMWNAYRGSGGTDPVEPPSPFAVGSRIAVIRTTNVRSSGTLSGTLLGTQATGNTGTIVAGPVAADNITWWQVNYDSGADGWSGGDNFEFSNTTAPSAPSAPTGLRVVSE
jgi:hypothetical protein